jgi:SsrA-binding protein
MAKAPVARKVVAQNRKARHDYLISDTFEAGLALTGTEVKACRAGGVQLSDAYADPRGGEIWLVNAHIPEYSGGNRGNHEPKRARKLLLHKREIEKLIGAVARAHMTVVPLELYFNERGRAKLLIGLAKGKTGADKRQTLRDRDWKREQARVMRERR